MSKCLYLECRSYSELCHLLKQKQPNLIIVIGGPEVMYDIDRFLNTFEIDYIMAGEGEIALDKLLTCLENKEEVCLQGVSTKEKEMTVLFHQWI